MVSCVPTWKIFRPYPSAQPNLLLISLSGADASPQHSTSPPNLLTTGFRLRRWPGNAAKWHCSSLSRKTEASGRGPLSATSSASPIAVDGINPADLVYAVFLFVRVIQSALNLLSGTLYLSRRILFCSVPDAGLISRAFPCLCCRADRLCGDCDAPAVLGTNCVHATSTRIAALRKPSKLSTSINDYKHCSRVSTHLGRVGLSLGWLLA